MSPEIMSLILVAGLAVLLAIGVEVFAAVGIMGAIGLVLFLGQPLGQFPYTAFSFLNSFVLTAVPLFVFMGAMFSNTGVVHYLFNAADKWFSALPGGIATSVIGANALFGAMCGSTIAATATFGKITYPEMERLGYDPKLSLGVIAVGGILSAAIPPSAILVVYGIWADTSVPRLFAAVLVPGLILTLLFMLTVMVLAKLNPSLAPKPPRVTWRERIIAIRDLLPWLGVIALVLGVIFGGIMTPTESAALGAVLSIVMPVAYRKMSYSALRESTRTTVKITAMVAFVVFAAKVFSQVLLQIGLTDTLSDFLISLPFGKYGVMAVIALMYLAAGCFVEDWSLMLITTPIILPVVTSLGFSSVWFGVWYIMVGEAGVITPPFGLNLFALHTVVPKHDVMTIALGALPFLVPMLLMAALLVAFPQLALWLPEILYRR